MGFEGYMHRAISEQPVPSAARTASGQTARLSGYGIAQVLRAQLDVTAASGTTPTLDVVIEDSVDGGVSWNAVGTFTQRTSAGRQVINLTTPFGPDLRVRHTILGALASFTFSVDWYAK